MVQKFSFGSLLFLGSKTGDKIARRFDSSFHSDGPLPVVICLKLELSLCANLFYER